MQNDVPEARNLEAALDDLHRALGRPRASLVWAKLELALGLAAASFALCGCAPSAWFSVPLFGCGAYLALAGHRSHLYDAMSRQTAAAQMLARTKRTDLS